MSRNTDFAAGVPVRYHHGHSGRGVERRWFDLLIMGPSIFLPGCSHPEWLDHPLLRKLHGRHATPSTMHEGEWTLLLRRRIPTFPSICVVNEHVSRTRGAYAGHAIHLTEYHPRRCSTTRFTAGSGLDGMGNRDVVLHADDAVALR